MNSFPPLIVSATLKHKGKIITITIYRFSPHLTFKKESLLWQLFAEIQYSKQFQVGFVLLLYKLVASNLIKKKHFSFQTIVDYNFTIKSDFFHLKLETLKPNQSQSWWTSVENLTCSNFSPLSWFKSILFKEEEEKWKKTKAFKIINRYYI